MSFDRKGAGASRRIRVLLVEDNPADARLVTLELSRASPDFAVVTVPRLSEAVARIRAGECDVVLADLGLPDSFGLGTAQKIVEAGPVPVIVLTGVDDEALGIQALQHGAQDFLVKGRADGRALARSIRYARGRQQAQAASPAGAAGREALLDHVLGATHEGLVVLDAAGIVRVANPAAARLLGVSESSLVGAPFPRDYPRTRGGVVQARIPLAAGRSRSIEVRSTALEWEGAPGHLVTILDLADRERAEAAERRLAQAATAGAPAIPPTVLVVEADEPTRAGLHAALAGKGCRVLEAKSGVEAVRQAAANEDLAVVVSDVTLPDMGSLEFARRVLDARPTTQLLICSFQPQDDLTRRGLLALGSRYLRRPFAADELVRAVFAAAAGTPPTP